MERLHETLISPEQEIVLLSMRIDHQYNARIKYLLDRPINWPTLQEFALKHGVMPQLYQSLKSLDNSGDSGLVPRAVMDKLGERYLTNAKRNLRLTAMILRVHDLLSDRGIWCMPIKGPILAQQLYGDTSLRHFTDLDLLIRTEDFQQCCEILEKEAFIAETPLNTKEVAWLLQADSEYRFIYQGDLLEIHWGIAEKGTQYPIKEDQLWNNLYPIDLNGRIVYSLSLENLFQMLCIHGAKHLWHKLIWITDLAHFTHAYPDIDWYDILERAKAIGFQRIAFLGLILSERLGGAQLPGEVSRIIRSDQKIEELAEEVIETLFGQAQSSEKEQFDFFLRCRERMMDRAYLLLDQIFKPKQTDWQMISLPQKLYPLYYLIRPLRLLYKFTILPIASR